MLDVLNASGSYVKADKRPLSNGRHCILVSTHMRHDARHVKKLIIIWCLTGGGPVDLGQGGGDDMNCVDTPSASIQLTL
jgi:hypothetical protein